MEFSAMEITATQNIRITVSGAVDKKGNPAPLDGPPVFTSNEPTVVTFDADPADPNTGIVSAVGPLSAGVGLTITGDADLGEGVETLTEQGLVAVKPGKATGFAVTVSAPEEQP